MARWDFVSSIYGINWKREYEAKGPIFQIMHLMTGKLVLAVGWELGWNCGWRAWFFNMGASPSDAVASLWHGGWVQRGSIPRDRQKCDDVMMLSSFMIHNLSKTISTLTHSGCLYPLPLNQILAVCLSHLRINNFLSINLFIQN